METWKNETNPRSSFTIYIYIFANITYCRTLPSASRLGQLVNLCNTHFFLNSSSLTWCHWKCRAGCRAIVAILGKNLSTFSSISHKICTRVCLFRCSLLPTYVAIILSICPYSPCNSKIIFQCPIYCNGTWDKCRAMSTLPGINDIPIADIPCMEIQIVDSNTMFISHLLSYLHSAYNFCIHLIAGISYQTKLH